MKNTGAAIRDLEWYIQLVQKFSERNALSSDCFVGDKGYTLEDLGSALGIRSMVWSH